NSKNKVEAHPRNVKSSLNKRNGTVKVIGSASVQKSKKQDDSDSVCVNSNDSMSFDNVCVSNAVNVVKSRAKKNKPKKDIWKPTGKVFTQIGYIWRPTGRTFTIVGNACPITRIYTTEGLGHNLFSVGQFCDSNLEVAFRQHTCFIRNLEGVDLLTGSRGDNLYTLSLGNMMASSPICLLSKASKTKSWLWHRRLSHLNFGSLNHLARHGLVRLCSACALGKSSKKPHKPKSEDTNQEKLYLLHMDLCGPMRVASVNGKKYILVIVDDYSRFTWVKCLRSKDEAPAFIINFLKMIQTLREYYEKVGISHETSVARSPQQNGVVERRNRTLIEAARMDTPMVEKSKLDEDKEGKVVDPSSAYRKALKCGKKDLSVSKRNRTSGSLYPKDSSFALTAFAECGFMMLSRYRRSTSGSIQLLGDRLAVSNLSSALFQSHGGRDISSLAILERVNCVLRISGLYTSRLLDAACKKVLNLLKKGLLKVEATLKSAWTEKDQIDNLLKERRFNTTAGNPVKKILLKLNLSDHRLFKDGGGVNESQERRSIKVFQDNHSERYEHAAFKDHKSTRWQSYKEGKELALVLWLMDLDASRSQCQLQFKEQATI
ncbi:retrovirus-related pol polyprotein from transposon TNT 1-94, partial [Tanacetum coccineum]